MVRRSIFAQTSLLVTSGLLFAACGTDIDRPDSGMMMMTEDELKTTDNGDGTFTSEVDARSEDAWIYMNLASGNQVTPDDPKNSTEWDIAFQRFKVKTNSGISGSGDACAYRLPNTTFDEVTGVPAGDCLVDQADGEDVGEIEDYAVSSLGDRDDTETGPWGYNPVAHEVIPIDDSFVVKAHGAETHYKLSFLSYYNTGGDAGVVVMNWATVTGMQQPPHPDELEFTGPISEDVFLKLGMGTVSAPADELTSLDWDLKVRQTGWSSNSGSSEMLMVTRTGTAAVSTFPSGTNFDEITKADVEAQEFSLDETMTFPGPPGSPQFLGSPNLIAWFTYNPREHTVESTGDVYGIRGADGQTYGLMQILTYKEDLESTPSTMTYKILFKTFD